MFNFLKKDSNNNKPAGDTSSPPAAKEKKGLWQRMQDAKRVEIPEDEVLKYTGKTKDEILEWSKTAPYVGGNRPAGSVAMGNASGIGGMAAADGYGGWGPGANPKLKYPPKAPAPKKLDDDDDD